MKAEVKVLGLLLPLEVQSGLHTSWQVFGPATNHLCLPIVASPGPGAWTKFLLCIRALLAPYYICKDPISHSLRDQELGLRCIHFQGGNN